VSYSPITGFVDPSNSAGAAIGVVVGASLGLVIISVLPKPPATLNGLLWQDIGSIAIGALVGGFIGAAVQANARGNK
jgi:uncharacterized membrane protein YfcA